MTEVCRGARTARAARAVRPTELAAAADSRVVEKMGRAPAGRGVEGSTTVEGMPGAAEVAACLVAAAWAVAARATASSEWVASGAEMACWAGRDRDGVEIACSAGRWAVALDM